MIVNVTLNRQIIGHESLRRGESFGSSVFIEPNCVSIGKRRDLDIRAGISQHSPASWQSR